MTHLDLTTDQSRELATTGKVTRRVRMEPQPKHRYERVYQYQGTIGNMLAITKNHAPHPPGTRAKVQRWACPLCNNAFYEDGQYCPTHHWGASGTSSLTYESSPQTVVCSTVTPEQHDGAWWWVETWEFA